VVVIVVVVVVVVVVGVVVAVVVVIVVAATTANPLAQMDRRYDTVSSKHERSMQRCRKSTRWQCADLV
jgi:hypothetical protein